MITDRDIQKMLERFKAVFVTRPEFEELREDMKIIKESVKDLPERLDQIAFSFAHLHDEYIAIKLQTDRHDYWIHKLADKTNTKLQS